MLELVLLGIAMAVVPIIRFDGVFGVDQAKEQATILLMGIAAIVMLWSGIPAFSGPNRYLLAVVVFCVFSLLWADHHHLATREVVRVLSVLVFCLLAQRVPFDFSFQAAVIPATVTALYGMSQQLLKKDIVDPRFTPFMRKKTRFKGWMGNSNYTAAYLVPCFFISLWLIWNVSAFYAISAVIIIGGIALSHCRAAQGAVALGLCIIEPAVLFMVIPAAIVTYMYKVGCKESVGHRLLMTRAAIAMWLRRPIFGWGPRCFRHKHTRAVAELNLKDPTILGNQKEPGRFQFTVGRRAHNDYAESLAEYGLLGCALCAAFLGFVVLRAWEADTFILAGVVAFMANAAFFLSFRDTGVSLPFWLLAGVAISEGQRQIAIKVNIEMAFIAALAIAYLVYCYAYKPWRANRAAEKGDLLTALKLEPYRTEWLYRITKEAMKNKNYPLAFNCAEKALFFYDGERPEWAVYFVFGSIALDAGAVDIAASCFHQAAILQPNAKEVGEAIKVIRGLEKERQRHEAMVKKSNSKKKKTKANRSFRKTQVLVQPG